MFSNWSSSICQPIGVAVHLAYVKNFEDMCAMYFLDTLFQGRVIMSTATPRISFEIYLTIATDIMLFFCRYIVILQSMKPIQNLI